MSVTQTRIIMDRTRAEILAELIGFCDSLPAGHAEKPGAIRAVEVVRSMNQ